MPGRVHEVVIENFKSYEGVVRIGPLKKFTCVVGPNGAGKSNFMDAISFVLGVRSRQLRSERLSDLVHRKEGEALEVATARSSSVELVFEDEQGNMRRFRRMINVSSSLVGVSVFQVDGKTVTNDQYQELLEGISIFSQARSFLVFQGDIEAAALRHDKELTAFFEQVSGSGDLRAEYNELAARKAQGDETFRHVYARQREAAKERRRVASQRDEAVRYQSLEAEFKSVQLEFYLFRFHIIKWRREEAVRTQQDLVNKHTEVQDEARQAKERLDVAERERAQANMERIRQEKASAAEDARLAQVSPDSIRTCALLEKEKQRRQELKDQIDRDAKRIQSLKEQLAWLFKHEDKMKRVFHEAKAKAEEEMPFTVEQRAEFDRATKAAAQVSATRSPQVRELEAKLQSLQADQSRVETDLREARARHEHLRHRVAELTGAKAAAQTAQDRDSQLAKQKAEELVKLQARQEAESAEKEKLLAKRQTILKDTQDITATNDQVERERKLKTITEKLMQMFVGVHGRVVGLASVPERRYRVSVNVALGAYLDAVLVENGEIGRQCIQHLKGQREAPMTFLPMDNLRTPPPDLKLREALRDEPHIRPAIDCIEMQASDHRYARVLQFLLGDVVIADSLEHGRRFLFEKLRRVGTSCRIVTLLGETISRDGNMAVSSDAARQGGTRFDAQEVLLKVADVEKNNREVEALNHRLRELSVASTSCEERNLQDQLKSSEAQVRARKEALERCEQELVTRQKELHDAQVAMTALSPEVDRLNGQHTRLEQERRDLEATISQEVSSYFAKLSQEMGVQDIRGQEIEWRRARQTAQHQERHNAQQLDSVRAEIKMLKKSLAEHSARDPMQAIEASDAEVLRLTQLASELNGEVAGYQSKKDDFSAQLKTLAQAEREKEKTAACCRIEARRLQQQLVEMESKSALFSADLQMFDDQKQALLRLSVMEDVEIKTVSAEFDAIEDVPMGDAENAAAEANMPDQKPASIEIDLEALPQERRAIVSGRAAKLQEDEYERELKRIKAELESLVPNLRAIGAFANAEGEAQDAQDEAAAAWKEIEEVRKQFEKMKHERRQLFMKCFTGIQQEINKVYKRLTAAAAGPGSEGGSAFLDLEDEDEPFNAGIKFTAMPPMKGLSDVTMLSGGEKTLAAMALIFATQAYQRPPFLILDEVDASLDSGNIDALASFAQESDFQVIVISLKDRFFSRGDGLVGVSKNLQADASVVFTMDLARLRAQARPRPIGSPLLSPLPLEDRSGLRRSDPRTVDSG